MKDLRRKIAFVYVHIKSKEPLPNDSYHKLFGGVCQWFVLSSDLIQCSDTNKTFNVMFRNVGCPKNNMNDVRRLHSNAMQTMEGKSTKF